MNLQLVILVSSIVIAFLAGVFVYRWIVAKKNIKNSDIDNRYVPVDSQGYHLRRKEIIHLNKANVLSESSRLELYSKLISLSLSQFRANMCAILFRKEDGEIRVLGVERAHRLYSILTHFYTPFFALGSQDSFGFQKTSDLDGRLNAFTSVGIRYILSLPVKDEDSTFVLWLGYSHPPDSSLIAGFKSFVEEISRDLPSLKHYFELSERIEVAERANKQKSEVIAHISHDIRAPLNNIKTILSLLKEEVGKNDLIDVAINNCNDVYEIVESMLDFSLHQAGKLSAKSEMLDLAQITMDVASSFKVQAKLKGLEFNYTNSNSLQLPINADKKQIKRIISNLISNAIKYTKYGKIDINCFRTADGTAIVEVKDTGIGMTEEQLSQLFVPFTRFESKNIEGIGLGLALSQVLASVNRGHITVSSKPNVGSVFRLVLPIDSSRNVVSIDKKEEEQQVRKRVPFYATKIKVLIVDDDVDCVSSLTRTLQNNDFEIFTAVTVADAISIINFERPDAILTDSSMPDGGGIKIINFARKIHQSSFIAILSGHSQTDLKERFGTLNVDKIFTKPVDINELTHWLKTVNQTKTISEKQTLVA